MKEFGEALRTAREEAHLTLDELFERTRISIKHLRAIEAGDFPSVPQTYVRAFIREYAQHVGLDEEQTITAYNELAARDKGIPKPPEAHDTTNILPHLDETIEIIRPGTVVPRHVEVKGKAEVAAPPTHLEPGKTPVHVETSPMKSASLEIIQSSPTGTESAGKDTPIDTPHPTTTEPEEPTAAEHPEPDRIVQTPPEAEPASKSPLVAPSLMQDSEKKRPHADLFQKMIAPAPERRPELVKTAEKPRRSVYDMMPPIPSEQGAQTQPPSPPPPSPPSPPRRRIDAGEKRTLLIGAVVILIITVVVYALIKFNSDTGQETGLIDSTSIKASLEQGKFLDSSQHAMLEAPSVPDTARFRPPVEQESAVSVKKTATKEDSLTLEAFTSAPVWFLVKIDTTKSERGSLSTNEHKVWRAKDRFYITLGDAGAVTFFLNGREIGTLGDEGVVIKNQVINRQSLSVGN